MAEVIRLTAEERASFFAAKAAFIEANDPKLFRETMRDLRKANGSIPEARKAFIEANPS